MDPNIIVAALPEILTQILGFLIVFFILKKYAFGTVFEMLDTRQKAIAALIEEAENKGIALESLKKEYEQKLYNIEQEAHLKIQVAVTEGQRIATEIREKAHADATAQLEYAKQEIKRETESARALVRQEVVELSSLMASKLIARNLSSADNEKYVLDLLSQTGEIL
ncbi:ATP synthase subunit b [Gammaproteobacteria bacterium]